MSFSKAKLLRFNEVHNSTPSPADYTILNGSHVVGAALSKSERFSELTSPASSDVSSQHSSCNVAVFRTPNPPPRRKPKTKPASNIKPIELFQSEDTLDALKEKIVECNNKDQYIGELVEQVEEMKQRLSECKFQLSTLTQDNSNLTETLINLNADKSILWNDQQKHLKCINEKLITVHNTYNKLDNVKSINCENIMDVNENIRILNDLLESYEMIYNRHIIKLKESDTQISELEKECMRLQKQHTDEIADSQQKYEKHIKSIQLKQSELENDFLKETKHKSELIKETEDRLNKLQDDFKIEKQTLMRENAERIRQLTENFKEASALAEMQFEENSKEIETSWQLKLEESKKEADAILKECQAIAEYNIIQSEIEKNQVIYDFNDHKNSTQLLKDDYEKLKFEFTELNNQYKELSGNVAAIEDSKVQIETELQHCKCDIDQMKKDKHKYEITIMKTHMLIDTLKNRLMDSDKDVEQLKTELEDTEASKLESEEKCSELEDELRTVLKLFDNVNKEIRAARQENKEKVRQVENDLLLKVEHFQNEGNLKISDLTHELTVTKQKLDDALKHLEEQQTLNIEAQKVIENSLKEIDMIKVCVKCNENEEKCNAFEQLLSKVELENQDLRKKISEQESLIGPFRELLEEHDALINQKYHVEQEAKEIGLKYAQLLGHQNQKQKIKHLMDLKKKNNELSENIIDLEAKVRQQTRTIEKLKKELPTSKFSKKKLLEDKENILNHSPNHVLNNSSCDNIGKERKN